MLPPCFTYFLDLSEFLRLYPHIGVKLGESEKYLVQCFIEGKLEMQSHKKNESISCLESEKEHLWSKIARLEERLRAHKRNEKDLEQKLQESENTTESLKQRVQELLDKNAECWSEIRRLKHYRFQQHELEEFLKKEEEEAEAAAAERAKNKKEKEEDDKCSPPSRSNTKTGLKREGSKLRKEGSNMGMQKEGSKLGMRKEVSNMSVKRQKSLMKRERSKLSDGNGKKAVPRPVTRGDIAATVKQHNLLRIQILVGQTNLLADKQIHLQLQLPHIQAEERRLQRLVNQGDLEKPILLEFKRALAEVRKARQSVQQEILNGDKETKVKEKALHDLRKKAHGVPDTPAISGDGAATLVIKLKALLQRFTGIQAKEMKELEERHEIEISKMVQHVQELNNKHVNEESRLRGRIKGKMTELNKREHLHRRLKNQINVMTRYHAKNMNATIPVEQCRQIVRSLIGEARKLAYIAEERDLQQEEPPTEQELKYMTKEQREQILQGQLEKEKKEKRKEAKKKKIKQRRRRRQGECW